MAFYATAIHSDLEQAERETVMRDLGTKNFRSGGYRYFIEGH
jgi:hypothetical protein